MFSPHSMVRRHGNPFAAGPDKFDAGARDHCHRHGDLVFYGQRGSGLYGNDLRNAIPKSDLDDVGVIKIEGMEKSGNAIV